MKYLAKSGTITSYENIFMGTKIIFCNHATWIMNDGGPGYKEKWKFSWTPIYWYTFLLQN